MTAASDLRFFKREGLADFSTAVFRHFGVPKADAEQAADVLTKSDIRGIDSHGVARLRTYVEMLELGRINPKPNIKIVRERASVATVDGDNGLGLIVGPKAKRNRDGQSRAAWLRLGQRVQHKPLWLRRLLSVESIGKRLDRLGDDQLD